MRADAASPRRVKAEQPAAVLMTTRPGGLFAFVAFEIAVETVLNALKDHLADPVVKAEGRGDVVPDSRVLAGCRGDQARDIRRAVAAG